MVLEKNGEVASIGAGAACLGHPLEALACYEQAVARFPHSFDAGRNLVRHPGSPNPLLSVAATTNALAAVTGSSSGGRRPPG